MEPSTDLFNEDLLKLRDAWVQAQDKVSRCSLNLTYARRELDEALKERDSIPCPHWSMESHEPDAWTCLSCQAIVYSRNALLPEKAPMAQVPQPTILSGRKY